MIDDVYRNREQTYLKHFLLRNYLEKVAYIIGWTYGSFVYVDAFSGPWRSGDENFEDTSFMIAINKLREVRDGLAERGRPADIQCLFVEKDPESYERLERLIGQCKDFSVKAIPGRFVEVIPDILRYVGKTFSLTFIDPTGWTGIPLQGIQPILQHSPGEVLINFMYDYYVRFRGTAEHARSFAAFMGGTGFEALSEEETIARYCQRVRELGAFRHVTSTRILYPRSDRSYFYLIYGTRDVRGLEVFREVEEREIRVQERVRLAAKDFERIARTRQPGLFAPGELEAPSSIEEQFIKQQANAARRLDALLDERLRVSYEEVLGDLLEMPLVWPRAVKRFVEEQRKAGRLIIEGLKPGERTPKKNCFLIRT